MADFKENMVEWISGEHYITVTLTDTKRMNRIKKIYEQRPDDFKFLLEDDNGYLTAKFPLKWLKFNPGAAPDAPKRELSEERKIAMRQALAEARAKKKNKNK